MLASAKRRLRALISGPSRERRLEQLVRAGRVSIGRHTYGVPEIVIFGGDSTRLELGRYVSIGHDVTFLLGGNHRVDWVTTFPLRKVFGLPGAGSDGHPASKGDIVVGHDVWLGYGARVLSGVTIGHGAVVGAAATVTRSVRPYSVVVGSPAREVRRRFDDRQIEGLLRVAWWDWSDSQVVAEVSQLCNSNIDDFLARHDRAGK